MYCYSLEDPKNDMCAWLYGCWWTYLHVYYQFCLNGRDVNNIEKQFVEISKKYSREAVVKAGGKVAA